MNISEAKLCVDCAEIVPSDIEICGVCLSSQFLLLDSLVNSTKHQIKLRRLLNQERKMQEQITFLRMTQRL